MRQALRAFAIIIQRFEERPMSVLGFARRLIQGGVRARQTSKRERRPYTAEEQGRIRAEFDELFYTRSYPEVTTTWGDAFTYFLSEGWRQGHDPNAVFSTSEYLALNRDVAAANMNPFAHFVLYGRKEGRRTKRANRRVSVAPAVKREPRNEGQAPPSLPSDHIYKTIQAEFDAAYYFQQHPEIAGENVDPIQHYIKEGYRKGLNPNKKFNTSYYLEANPDVERAQVNPFYHYLTSGKAEGRFPSPVRHGNRTSFFSLLSTLPEEPLACAVTARDATIIVPIYNNFDDVSALIESLHRTVEDETCVVLVDDCSPDARMAPLLSFWASKRKHWRFIQNSENLGFAHSVNRGIALAEGHPIVVNSDVQLPPGWVQRILQPILSNPESVASVTPFSNHSSLTGFPHPRSEVALSEVGDLREIDSAFRKIKLVDIDLPSCVGFCVAMNRGVVDKLGAFDGESYSRGYYEDTDWGQRAVAAGYRNVVCTNLFVHHGTDSKSFSIRQRRELSEHNRKILLKKFPHYAVAERQFHEIDRLFEIRVAAEVAVERSRAKSALLMIDHSWGGGANDFSARFRDKLIAEGALVAHMILDRTKVLLRVHYGQNTREVEAQYGESVWKIAAFLNVDRIIVNGIHGAENTQDVLKHLARLAERYATTVYTHDFLAVCPSIFLLKRGHTHCGVPEITQCQACYFDNPNIKYDSFNIVEWRRSWSMLLTRAADILVFSESSKELLRRGFPHLSSQTIRVVSAEYAVNLPVVPLPPVDSTLRIGVVGTMNTHKGSRIVLHLVNYIRNNLIGAKVSVVGAWYDTPPPKALSINGPYRIAELPLILQNEKIDVVLFPSVCPETFSGTLSELFAMRVPVVSLPLGAQGERVSQYEFGEVTTDETPAAILVAARRAVRKRRAAVQEV